VLLLPQWCGGWHIKGGVFLGPAARAIVENISFRPPGGVYLTENVFFGPAARLFLPVGPPCSAKGGSLFLGAQKK